ncbi:MAG: sigma-70 family RNA polymerase sigma factor [Planctomycetota bacterium]
MHAAPQPDRTGAEDRAVQPDGDPGAAWMVAWAAGDEAAFERLVRAYSGRVHGLLTRFLGPVSEREDLTQEVFLRLIRGRDNYQPTARFTTYLYRIVFNLAANEREKLRLRRTASLDGGADEQDGPIDVPDGSLEAPDARLDREARATQVRAAIDALPDSQRAALLLAKFEDLSLAEIGEVLGLSTKAVKSLVHRARENLRTSLAGLLTEEVA